MNKYLTTLILTMFLISSTGMLLIAQTSEAQALYNQAVQAYESGNLEEAIELLDEAIRLEPDFIDAYINRGVAYADLGDYRQAIADFTHAIRLDENFALPYNNR